MTESISTSVVIKHCTYALAGITGAVTYIGLEPKAIYALGILMVMDTITGVAKSVFIHGSKSYKSLKLAAGVVTKVLILTVPFVLAIAGHGAGVDLLFIASASITLLIFSETSSILGNIHSLAKKEDTAEFDAISLIYSVFKGFIERYMETVKNIKK